MNETTTVEPTVEAARRNARRVNRESLDAVTDIPFRQAPRAFTARQEPGRTTPFPKCTPTARGPRVAHGAWLHIDAKPQPLEFIAVAAHLLYGTRKIERQWEFDALMDWVLQRACHAERMYYKDMIVLGDMNLFFEDPEQQRTDITARLKAMNTKNGLHKAGAAELYLPFLDPHPKSPPPHEVFRTNARQDQTFDQFAFVTHSPRLPTSAAKASAGATPDGFNYGVFNYLDLFSRPSRRHAAVKRSTVRACQR